MGKKIKKLIKQKRRQKQRRRKENTFIRMCASACLYVRTDPRLCAYSFMYVYTSSLVYISIDVRVCLAQPTCVEVYSYVFLLYSQHVLTHTYASFVFPTRVKACDKLLTALIQRRN